MEHSYVTKILLIVFALLCMLYAVFFVVNVVCRTSVYSCTRDADCITGTVCVDHGYGEVRCAPPACKAAQTSYDASGIEGIANRSIAFVAQKSAQFGHWLLQLKNAYVHPKKG